MSSPKASSTTTSTTSEELHHCVVCDKLTSEKCTVCGKVYYCGLEHEDAVGFLHKFIVENLLMYSK
jgi:hypothetical protein